MGTAPADLLHAGTDDRALNEVMPRGAGDDRNPP
jgi:hypothetical protein